MGVVFLGTPHRGSEVDPLGQIMAIVARFTFSAPNTQLIASLKENSHTLESQRDSFVSISNKWTMFCLYGELPTLSKMVSAVLMVSTSHLTRGLQTVPEHLAVFDGFRIRKSSIHANQSDMCKFSDTQESGYQRVLGSLRELVNILLAEAEQVDKDHEKRLKIEYLIRRLPSIDSPNFEYCTESNSIKLSLIVLDSRRCTHKRTRVRMHTKRL